MAPLPPDEIRVVLEPWPADTRLGGVIRLAHPDDQSKFKNARFVLDARSSDTIIPSSYLSELGLVAEPPREIRYLEFDGRRRVRTNIAVRAAPVELFILGDGSWPPQVETPYARWNARLKFVETKSALITIGARGFLEHFDHQVELVPAGGSVLHVLALRPLDGFPGTLGWT